MNDKELLDEIIEQASLGSLGRKRAETIISAFAAANLTDEYLELFDELERVGPEGLIREMHQRQAELEGKATQEPPSDAIPTTQKKPKWVCDECGESHDYTGWDGKKKTLVWTNELFSQACEQMDSDKTNKPPSEVRAWLQKQVKYLRERAEVKK